MFNKNDRKTKWVASYGILITISLVASYIEVLIPMFIVVPGAKIGLANVVTMVALYLLGTKDAIVITILRIVLSGFLFGNVFAIVYSISGATLSFFCMLLLKKLKFEVVTVSMIGGIAHNVGQLLLAAYLVENIRVLYYLPVLFSIGGIAGALIGMIGGGVIKRLHNMT